MEVSSRRKKKEKGRLSNKNLGEKRKKEEKVSDEDKATARIDSKMRAREIVDVIEEESWTPIPQSKIEAHTLNL